MVSPINNKIPRISLEELKTFSGSDEKVTMIYLVRHGQSFGNIKHYDVKYVQGQSPQFPLTKKGERQAIQLTEQMVPRMKGLNPILVTSTAKRAIDTAQPLACCLQRTTTAYKEFLELGSGEWEGVSKEDPGYKAEYGKWQNLSANQKFSTPKVSTGESYSETALRALNGLSQVLSQVKENETVFLFSHYMLMNAVILSLTPTELSLERTTPLPECSIENGDIISIEIPRGASVDQGRIVSIINSNLKSNLEDS